MKRTTKAILAAVLILAVSIPLLALAASEPTAPPADGIVVEDTRVLPDGVFVGDDGFCYMLDENGDAQRLYVRGSFGRYMALQFADGAYCWSYDYENQETLQTRNTRNPFGRGCPRWN